MVREREREEERGREENVMLKDFLRSTDHIENERLSHGKLRTFIRFLSHSSNTNILGWLNSKLVTVNW